MKSTGSWYSVLCDGLYYQCRARGRIRLKGVRTTNPIAVGDWVFFSLENGDNGFIEDILPRENYIIRRSTNLSHESHIIASNLSLALIVVTLVEPATPIEFVDRFLATATAYSIPAGLIMSKCDLASEREASELMGMRYIYKDAGYHFLEVSTVTGEGLAELRAMMSSDLRREPMMNHITLLCGQSGVGKSTIINALSPSLNLRTHELSESTGLGQHTTTFSEMFPLEGMPNSYVVDTPGIRGFGVIDFDRYEISHFFPDIFAISPGCKFSNCLHVEEPGCAVVKALEEGDLAPSRYASYLSLLEDHGQKYR